MKLHVLGRAIEQGRSTQTLWLVDHRPGESYNLDHKRPTRISGRCRSEASAVCPEISVRPQI